MNSVAEQAHRRDTPYGERFTLFAEVLWIGLLVAAGSLFVVTWPAALAAGCAQVRRCVPDGPSPGTARRFLRDWYAALRGGSAVGAVGLLALAFLGADLRLASTAGVPGFGALALVIGGAAGAVVVAQVRRAAHWSATGRWARPHRDVRGAVMLAGAVLISAVCVWQLVILAPLVLGVLALAAVAVDRRHAGPARGAGLCPSAAPPRGATSHDETATRRPAPGLRPGPRSSIAGGA